MKLFISWSGSYALEIAKKLKITIDQLSILNANKTMTVETWLSTEDIEAGEKWRDELNTALSEASIGILVITQDVIDSHYLPHEAGALSTQGKKIIILLVDSPQVLLPKPLRDYQFMSISNVDLALLLRKIAKESNSQMPSPKLLAALYEDISKIREENSQKYVIADNYRWENRLERPFIISTQMESPYDLEQVLKIASKRLVLIAQNHYHMTEPKRKNKGDLKYWPLIKEKLLAGVDIEIVSMHPTAIPSPFISLQKHETKEIEAPNAINLWAYYMNNSEFLRHSREQWETLNKWDSQFRELKQEIIEKKVMITQNHELGNLKIFGSYFTPVTMSFVDPEEPYGLLVLSPRMSHEASSARPQIIIKKSSCPNSFQYYWGTIDNSFANAGWIHLNI